MRDGRGKDEVGGGRDKVGGGKDKVGGGKDEVGGGKDEVGGGRDEVGGGRDEERREGIEDWVVCMIHGKLLYENEGKVYTHVKITKEGAGSIGKF